MTSYIVLRNEGDKFSMLGSAEATGPVGAVQKVVAGVEGDYVAVPVRNWTEVRVASETQTRTRYLTHDDPVRPTVLNPEAVGDPDQTPIVQT